MLQRKQSITKRQAKTYNSAFLAFCGLTYALYVGPTFLLGVFFIEFQRDLGATASQASLATVLPAALEFLGGPFYSVMYNALGYRKCFMLAIILEGTAFIACSQANSIIAVQFALAVVGIGSGMSSLTMYSSVGKAFGKKRALANSLLSTAGVITACFLGPLTQYLIQEFTWRGGTLILAGIVLNGIPSVMVSSWFYVENPTIVKEGFQNQNNNADTVTDDLKEGENENNDIVKNIPESTKHIERCTCAYFYTFFSFFDYKILCDVYYWLFTLAMSFTTLGLVSIVLYLVRYSQDIGIDDTTAVWLLSIARGMFMVVCPIVGFLSSYCSGSYETKKPDNNSSHAKKSFLRIFANIRRAHLLAIIQLFFAFSIIFPTFNETYSQFFVFSVLVGIASGATGALPITVLADMFGAEKLPSALGFRALLTGTIILVAPPLIGKLIDSSGTYRVAQYICSLCVFCAAILTSIAQFGLYRKKRSQSKSKMMTSATQDIM